jgi:hypothetical protein
MKQNHAKKAVVGAVDTAADALAVVVATAADVPAMGAATVVDALAEVAVTAVDMVVAVTVAAGATVEVAVEDMEEAEAADILAADTEIPKFSQ